MSATGDLQQLPGYTASAAQLERFLLFSVAVAGKTAKQIDKAIDVFLAFESEGSPFERVRVMMEKGTLLENLQRASLGRYSVLYLAFSTMASSSLDLRSVTVEALEKIHGIGPKTSRFFLMYTRPNVRVAVLDTHQLKFMRAVGLSDIPRSTPSGAKYRKLEVQYLRIAEILAMSPAQLDTQVWEYYANRKNEENSHDAAKQDYLDIVSLAAGSIDRDGGVHS